MLLLGGMKPELTLRIRIQNGHDIVIGPGRADLLQHIAATGSIAAAGRQMNMSYRRAWVLVEAMNTTFTAPLVEASKGGAGGGGARLTSLGEQMLAAYREMENEAKRGAAAAIQRITAALPVTPGRKTS
jgi:molybdate transport system regulatory protein